MGNTSPTPAPAPELLKVRDVAQRLSVSRRHVYTLIELGKIAAVKLSPRTTRVPAAEVERLLRGGSA